MTVPAGPAGQGGALPSLFANGGEVGRVMETWEWSATAVGPPAHWSPTLRTLVRVVLTSRFPMWLGWGPELTFFYNDAYRRDTLGVKHPWALARPAWEVWAEIWADIGPRIEAVMRTGTATWDEALLLFLERSGYREETYHTFSYSPVSEADGRVAGMLCVVTEETDRVIGERRMSTLRQLASQLSGTRNEAEVFAAVAERVGENLRDLPFTLTYVFEPSGHARLACTTGVPAGHAAAPLEIGPGHSGWERAAAEVRRSGQAVLVEPLSRDFPDLPSGFWDVPAERAIVVPLSQQGQVAPAGLLVAGLSPYRDFDPAYSGFVELLAGQIAAGIASARAYEAERKRAESLAELDRAKTEFFSNVSHEFRTPLTLILGPAEDILNDDLGPLPDAQVARLEVVRRNARRLQRLVNDMLDFARIEGGRLRAETVATNLGELTRDIAMSFAPAISRAGLELRVECPDLDRPVLVDPDMWEKIVLNLLSNALKFTLKGEVTTSLRDLGDAVELSVADSGVGIPPDQLPFLFQRFHRVPVSAARSYEGTGIGLALVSELVRLHDGSISVESQEGRGSVFRVTVPYGEKATGTPGAQRDSSRQAYLDEALQWSRGPEQGTGTPALGAGRTSEAKVLVVDDNPDMREYLARLLSPFWVVRLAEDGQAALRLVREDRPDLVLTDVMMPGLDGFGLLQALRRDPETATLPVVFLSARAGEESAVEGLEAGADDYLVKPFSALELLARVRSNLELARLRNRDAAWRTTLVESLREGVAVMEAGGVITEVNAAFERILGYGRDELPYRPPFPWFPDPETEPEQFQQAQALLQRILSDGYFNGIARLRHRDGPPVFVEASVASAEDGGQRRYVIAVRDVTAELLTSEREAALARLGIRLAEASDVREVQEAGLAELQQVFGAARSAGVWYADHNAGVGSPVVASGELDDQTATGAMDEARGSGRVVLVSRSGEDAPREDSPCVGMAAPFDPAAPSGAVWIGFDRPTRVSNDDRTLFVLLSGYIGQALRRAQLFDDSKAVATAMQRAILGPSDTPEGVAVRYAPAVRPLEVGGDWYDAVELSNGRLGLVVGDCVGRGLQAATVMGQLRSACRALLLQTASPAQVVSALDTFAERIPGASCTTVFCGVIDPAEGVLRYCNAGHLPGLLMGPDGRTTFLSQRDSLPLGIFPYMSRRESVEAVPAGYTLVVCTDGLVERRGESIDVGLDRLVDAVRSSSTPGAEQLADYLMANLLPREGQQDDVALVIYRPLSDQDRRYEFIMPSHPAELAAFRRDFHGWLDSLGLPPQTVTEVLVACGEACSNAMEHAYGFSAEHTVRVSAQAVDGTIDVVVEDNGHWEPPSSDGGRGRGLKIMHGLMDGVEIDPSDDGTRVHLRKELSND